MVLDPQLVIYTLDLIWISWALYWTALAFGNKRTIYRQSRRSRLIYLAFAAVVYLIATREMNHHYVFFQENVFTQVLGLFLCICGIAITIWARLILGTNWSGLITLKENHELIQNGPYKFVRHPIYSGLILAAAGSVIAANPTARGLLIVAFLAVSLKLKSLGEEKILIPQFPNAYPQYRRQVKSLIPFVW